VEKNEKWKLSNYMGNIFWNSLLWYLWKNMVNVEEGLPFLTPIICPWTLKRLTFQNGHNSMDNVLDIIHQEQTINNEWQVKSSWFKCRTHYVSSSTLPQPSVAHKGVIVVESQQSWSYMGAAINVPWFHWTSSEHRFIFWWYAATMDRINTVTDTIHYVHHWEFCKYAGPKTKLVASPWKLKHIGQIDFFIEVHTTKSIGLHCENAQ
jgi:hypothetical protein